MLRYLSENSDYFIQHNAFREMKGAENYLNSNPALKNAELINMVISNELHYVFWGLSPVRKCALRDGTWNAPRILGS